MGWVMVEQPVLSPPRRIKPTVLAFRTQRKISDLLGSDFRIGFQHLFMSDYLACCCFSG